jgi:hypothetical protein
MSMHLLDAWDRGARALHTAADDLESFFWVIIWSLVKIFKKVATFTEENSIILRLEGALSSHRFDAILRRESLKYNELVFKGLVNDWREIKQKSDTIVDDFEERLMAASKRGDKEAEISILNEVDTHCLTTYARYIRKGYKHLQTIKKFTSWQEVIDHNSYYSLY